MKAPFARPSPILTTIEGPVLRSASPRATLTLAQPAFLHQWPAIYSGLTPPNISARDSVRTSAFLRFSISLVSVLQGISDPQNANFLEDEIRRQHSYQSFQRCDKIADAIRLISDVRLWETVGNSIGINAEDVKGQLDLIVDRRNKIAHEADINPTIALSLPGSRWPIDETLVDNAINFIEQVVETIHRVVR